jgi:hypothetical protein
MKRKTQRRIGLDLQPRTMTRIVIWLVFVSLAGLGYVWQKKEIHALGRDIRLREARLEELKRSNANLQRAFAAMCSPVELEARMRRMNLGLAAPLPDQIVRMPEPPPLRNTQQARVVAERNTNQTKQ